MEAIQIIQGMTLTQIANLFCLVVLCSAFLVLRQLFLPVISVILHSIVYEAEITLIA